MRRRTKQMQKLKVKILQDRKKGLTYKQIEAKRGVSSRTVANLLKGRDPQRFCGVCAETNAEKLHEHHPDRVNRPNETITLCANHHEEITRKQERERRKKKKDDADAQDISPPTIPPVSPPVPRTPQAASPARPLSPEEQRRLRKELCNVLGITALGKGVFDETMSGPARLLFGIAGLALLYRGYKQ